MREENTERSQNEAKLLQVNKAYFALRYSLIKQMNDITNVVNGDADKKLLASLKRTLKGLKARFERTGVKIDADACAKILLEEELPNLMEQITPYVCFGIMNADVLISPGQTDAI